MHGGWYGNGQCLCTSVRKHTRISDVIMGAITSQITSLTIVYPTVYSSADERKHQSSVSLAFVQGIHRWPVNSPHKGPVTQKMFPFDDVIMMHILDHTHTLPTHLPTPTPTATPPHPHPHPPTPTHYIPIHAHCIMILVIVGLTKIACHQQKS